MLSLDIYQLGKKKLFGNCGSLCNPSSSNSLNFAFFLVGDQQGSPGAARLRLDVWLQYPRPTQTHQIDALRRQNSMNQEQRRDLTCEQIRHGSRVKEQR